MPDEIARLTCRIAQATGGMARNGNLSVAVIRGAKQFGTPRPDANKNKAPGGRLTPVEAAFLKISGGISTLQSKDLSAADRKQVEELVMQLSYILTN